MIKTPILVSCTLWALCFFLVMHLLFSIKPKDEKNYHKHIAYILDHSTKDYSHPLTQYKEKVRKEFWKKDLHGQITAKKSKWIFDPKQKIYLEEFEKIKGEVFQDGSLKKVRAKNGLYNFKTHELSLDDIKTSFCYPTEKGNMASISSSSKHGVFFLDPKNPSFSLDNTKGKMVQ